MIISISNYLVIYNHWEISVIYSDLSLSSLLEIFLIQLDMLPTEDISYQ